MAVAKYLMGAATLASALALTLVATPALADALVVRSSGPSAASYPVGRRLPATERVVLRAGDRVTIIGEGPSRTLSGPGNFPVRAANAANSGNASTLGRYLSATGGTISRTGAVRGAGDGELPSAPPNLWVVNLAHGGTHCVIDLTNVTLWRADMRGDTLLTIENASNAEERAQIAFVAGQNFRRWPSDALPIRSGVTYRITGAGAGEANSFSFVALGAAPTDAESAANALANAGCSAQLAQLGEQLDMTASGY